MEKGAGELQSTPETEREGENRRFATRDEACVAIFDYIEVWYNRRRRHPTQGHLSPVNFEQLHAGDKISVY